MVLLILLAQSIDMTTPSLYKSFDTSLVDVKRSFESTEHATIEGSCGEENRAPSRKPDGGNDVGRVVKSVGAGEVYRSGRRRVTPMATSCKLSMMCRWRRSCRRSRSWSEMSRH